MQVLIDKNNIICFHGGITKSLYKRIDPYTPVYKIVNENGVEYAASSYILTDIEVPSDYEDKKYIYKDKNFKINSNWVQIKIQELKKYLNDTDWVCNKCFEEGLSVETAYPEIHMNRLQTRLDINKYEELLKSL